MQKHRVTSAAAMVVGLMLLSGCTSTQQRTGRSLTPLQYASVIEAMKGSPALRRSEIQRCSAGTRSSPHQRDQLRLLLNVSPNRDPTPLFCQRLIGALTSGRLNYADYRNSMRSEITPKLIRVIQGR